MKLELKHLAPYLPYGLNINEGGVNRELTGIKIKKDGSLCVNYDSIMYAALGNFKPVLRPLSDLSKELKLKDGSRLYPSEQLGISSIDIDGIVYDGNEHYGINYLFYTHIKALLEWHFDVFGLIEKGLAISIHDVVQAEA
jgi:hypothetical protein